MGRQGGKIVGFASTKTQAARAGRGMDELFGPARSKIHGSFAGPALQFGLPLRHTKKTSIKGRERPTKKSGGFPAGKNQGGGGKLIVPTQKGDSSKGPKNKTLVAGRIVHGYLKGSA